MHTAHAWKTYSVEVRYLIPTNSSKIVLIKRNKAQLQNETAPAAAYIPIVDINGSTGDEVGLIGELERKDLEAQREATRAVVKVVLTDDVLACVQILVEPVELETVLLDGWNKTRGAMDVDDV